MLLLTAATGGVPGELVLAPMVCDSPGCGCEENFIGMSSNSLVTVAVVADVDMTGDDLTGMVSGYLADRGWGDDEELVADVVADMREQAEHPVGARVRREDGDVVPE